MITRPDGSIIVGGAQYTFVEDRKQWYNVIDDSTLIEPAKNYYDDFMQRTFKGWDDSGAYVKEIWTGSKCLILELKPLNMSLPTACNSHGLCIRYRASRW